MSWRLSHSSKTNDPDSFHEYLKIKGMVDAETHAFYFHPKWKAWKFRIHCKQKSSEDRPLNRTEAKYDAGDSSLTSGFRKLLSHRFQMEEVDEYLTSKTCCHCHGRLERYSMDPKG